jgi:CheY-like chemotaxis protein
MGRATVLIVDDDRDIVEFLEEALGLEGYRVLPAVNWEALRLAHEQRPDVDIDRLLGTVADASLSLPGRDGQTGGPAADPVPETDVLLTV